MTTPNRLRWAAAALVSVALGLASQLALAHGGHRAEPAVAPAVVSTPAGEAKEVVAASSTVPSVTQTAWSQSCPDGSGGGCCCQHQRVTPGVSKTAIVHSSGWVLRTPPSSSRSTVGLTQTPPQQPAVLRALPRAPPSFS